MLINYGKSLKNPDIHQKQGVQISYLCLSGFHSHGVFFNFARFKCAKTKPCLLGFDFQNLPIDFLPQHSRQINLR